RARARSFNHTSTMDFWTGDDRVRTSVYVMGERGKRIRLNALDPAGGMTMADLACDGANCDFIDHRRNCQLTGPCTPESIATLMLVRLAPDYFVLLALGQPAVLPGPLEGSVEWAEEEGVWRVALGATDGRRQRLTLSGDAGRRWDVVGAGVTRGKGEVEWRLTQNDFTGLTDPSG